MLRPNRLRNHARTVLERVSAAGHRVYVWSGNGIRRYEMEQRGLDHLVSGYLVKPVERYCEQLARLGVDVEPDFVVDDHPGIVEAFGGYQVSLYLPDDDRDLLNARAAIEAAARTGPSGAV